MFDWSIGPEKALPVLTVGFSFWSPSFTFPTPNVFAVYIVEIRRTSSPFEATRDRAYSSNNYIPICALRSVTVIQPVRITLSVKSTFLDSMVTKPSLFEPPLEGLCVERFPCQHRDIEQIQKRWVKGDAIMKLWIICRHFIP